MKKMIRIVVLQRGWVMVGEWNKVAEDECILTNAACIREWGTERGLGQLRSGPTEKTVLDFAGLCRYHPLTQVLAIDCDNEEAWTRALAESEARGK
jgi:hypothetical protein